MRHHPLPFGAILALLPALLSPALAQQSREFYKKPETTAEYWRAMKHEIALGNFSVADAYLKGFLAKNPTDEELLQIQEQEGNSAFLRLLTIPELRKDAQPLVERVDRVVQRYLSDRKRLDALIKNLGASPEERAYAIAQLGRSGAAAVPALVDALLATADDPEQHTAILSALPRLPASTVPPLLAALDISGHPALQAELIELLRQRAEVGATPYLWYLSASPKISANVRAQAKQTLAAFLRQPPSRLPSAKAALTQEAERYYEHQVRFADPERVTVWIWDGQHVVAHVLTPSQAEEYFGLRWARQALDLDPTYRPAQAVFLSMALDKGVQRVGLDQPLTRGAPGLEELITSVSPGLLIAVLERALQERRLPVILGAVRGLGNLVAVQAAQPTANGPPVLAQALAYPDRRVQMAAADALLHIGSPPPSGAGSRVVEILRRAVGTDTAPKVLIADRSEDRANAVAQAVRQAGFETVIVQTGREALSRLEQAADIDVVLVDAGIVDPMLPDFLAQVGAGVDTGGIPVLVTTTSDRVSPLQGQLSRYRNVWVIPAAADAEAFKRSFQARMTEVMGKPLSPTERRDDAARAMEWLARLARGEVPGYDIRPAVGAVVAALRSRDLAALAVEAAGRLPGRDVQQGLANVVLDPNRPEALRSQAAVELCRNIQQNGRGLHSNLVQALQALYNTMPPSRLRASVALVMGSLHPDARQTGERLERFVPVLTAPAPPRRERVPVPPRQEEKGAATGEPRGD